MSKSKITLRKFPAGPASHDSRAYTILLNGKRIGNVRKVEVTETPYPGLTWHLTGCTGTPQFFSTRCAAVTAAKHAKA